MNRGTGLVSGGTWIPNIVNVAVVDDAWTAIELGADDLCRAVEAGLRSGGQWKLSHLSDGARYRTIDGNISLDIIKGNSKRLFYAQTASGNATLECILLD